MTLPPCEWIGSSLERNTRARQVSRFVYLAFLEHVLLAWLVRRDRLAVLDDQDRAAGFVQDALPNVLRRPKRNGFLHTRADDQQLRAPGPAAAQNFVGDRPFTNLGTDTPTGRLEVGRCLADHSLHRGSLLAVGLPEQVADASADQWMR